MSRYLLASVLVRIKQTRTRIFEEIKKLPISFTPRSEERGPMGELLGPLGPGMPLGVGGMGPLGGGAPLLPGIFDRRLLRVSGRAARPKKQVRRGEGE